MLKPEIRKSSKCLKSRVTLFKEILKQNKQTISQADAFLIKFQKCKEAWAISIQLLNLANQDDKVET